MYRGLRISLVIPTHNEARGLSQVLASLPKEVDEVIVVDWASTDGTPDVARAHGAKVAHEARRGYGRAYQTGIPLSTGDAVVTLDADGTYPVGHIPQLLDHLVERELDFISCARFPLHQRGSMPLTNRLGNQMLLRLSNAMFGMRLTDLLSGMWVFRRHVWDRIEPESADWSFSHEIKIRAAWALGERFSEAWIPYADRVGSSKLSPLSVGVANLQHLVALRVALRAHQR